MQLQRNTSKLNKLTYQYYLTVCFPRDSEKKIVEGAINTKQGQ